MQVLDTHRFRRAEHNEDDRTYLVLHDDGSRVVYSFVLLDDEEDEITLALQKSWEDEGQYFALYSFRDLSSPTGWDDIVKTMIARAKDTASEENVDEFLCVIDIAKHWAIDDGLDDESIEYVEGLFVEGPHDAYSLREYKPQRLHHHVERPDDECWRIDVARTVSVNDPAQELGWVAYAIFYPELVSASDEDAIAGATYAHLLDLEHHRDEVGARLAAHHLKKFMIEGMRVQDPEYAYMNDTIVLECISVLGNEQNDYSPTWQVLKEEALKAFREQPILRRKDWYPRDLFRELVDHAKMNPAHVDQLEAMWRDDLGVTPEPFKDDSPFNDSDL